MVWCEGAGTLISSKKGYAVTMPDNLPNDYEGEYRNLKCTESLEEAKEIQKSMQKDSKYPNFVVIWSCWLKEYSSGIKTWDVNSEK